MVSFGVEPIPVGLFFRHDICYERCASDKAVSHNGELGKWIFFPQFEQSVETQSYGNFFVYFSAIV